MLAVLWETINNKMETKLPPTYRNHRFKRLDFPEPGYEYNDNQYCNLLARREDIDAIKNIKIPGYVWLEDLKIYVPITLSPSNFQLVGEVEGIKKKLFVNEICEWNNENYDAITKAYQEETTDQLLERINYLRAQREQKNKRTVEPKTFYPIP